MWVPLVILYRLDSCTLMQPSKERSAFQPLKTINIGSALLSFEENHGNKET